MCRSHKPGGEAVITTISLKTFKGTIFETSEEIELKALHTVGMITSYIRNISDNLFYLFTRGSLYSINQARCVWFVSTQGRLGRTRLALLISRALLLKQETGFFFFLYVCNARCESKHSVPPVSKACES